jgi:hypothetical protein
MIGWSGRDGTLHLRDVLVLQRVAASEWISRSVTPVSLICEGKYFIEGS